MRVVPESTGIVLTDFSMVSGWDHHGDHETTVYEGSSVPPTARSWSAAGRRTSGYAGGGPDEDPA